MTRQDNLKERIAALIERRTEGSYWDFKRNHHESKYDLVHDVLCLANTKHRGRRFLIFGVADEDFSLHSISNDAKRRTQADVAGLFRDNADKFFQSRFPEFYLKEIEIDGKFVDVMVIEDRPHKPYYFTKQFGKIKAHHIYTRICDTNTPANDAAQPDEIEQMWRERFGLDESPIERVKNYLSDPHSWIQDNVGSNLNAYYKFFPEFTLKITDAEDCIACHEEWTRGEICSENNYAGYYEIHYHQTCLARIRYVSFDDRKKSMIAPDSEVRGSGRFYFYEIDSINYTIQKYLSTRYNEDHSQTLSIRGQGDISNKARFLWGCYMNIPVLRTGELDDFLGMCSGRESAEQSRDEAEQYELFLHNQIEFENWRNK